MTGETNDSAKIARYQKECEKLSDFLDIEIDPLPLSTNKF